MKAGQEVRLSVNVIGHPEPAITWSRKSGEEVKSSYIISQLLASDSLHGCLVLGNLE